MHARWQWHSPGASRPRAESRRFASLESVSIRKMRKKERERERFLRSRNLIASSRDDTWHCINPRSFHGGSGDVRPHTDYPRERTFNLTSLLSFLDRNNRMCSPRLCVYTCLCLTLSVSLCCVSVSVLVPAVVKLADRCTGWWIYSRFGYLGRTSFRETWLPATVKRGLACYQ